MTAGREGTTLGLMTDEAASTGASQPSPCDLLRLLASILVGARPPVIAGGSATLTVWLPLQALDDLVDAVAEIVDPDTADGPPNASGAWSGVLLPMQREAARLLPEILDGIGAIEPYPPGGCDVTMTLALAVHDRLALWGASLDLVAHLIEPIEARPALPLTSLDPAVPQEMAAIILDLYAQGRPTPESPDQLSAA